jgi:hypothetical protein
LIVGAVVTIGCAIAGGVLGSNLSDAGIAQLGWVIVLSVSGAFIGATVTDKLWHRFVLHR